MLKERATPTSGGHGSRHPAGGLPVPGGRRSGRRAAVGKNGSPNGRRPGGPWGGSASLPNPVVRQQQQQQQQQQQKRQPARVRVQAGAGDKCVAPGKSKLKRRQAVPGRTIEPCGPSMDAVLWSDQVYTVPQLIHAYGAKLPIIARVEHGYHSNEGLSLTPNQVVQCHSFDKELRVKANVDSGTGRVNLPANYPIQVFYKDGNTEERTSLSELLRNRKPPLNVLVTSVDEDVSMSTVDVVGRGLLITELYQEIYMRINTITDGWLDQDGIYAIPACFGTTFSVAIGMRGASEAEWADYYGMFARSVRHLNFGLLSGYDGIIIEDDGGGTIKLQTISGGEKRVYENINNYPSDRRSQTLDPKPSTSRENHVYENLASEKLPAVNRPNRNRPPSIDYAREEIRITSSRVGIQTSDGGRSVGDPGSRQTGFDPPTGLPDLLSSPTSASDRASRASEDVEEMFQSVLDVAAEEESQRMKSEADSKRTEDQILLFARRRKEEEERREKIRLEIQRKELERIRQPLGASSSRRSAEFDAEKERGAAPNDAERVGKGAESLVDVNSVRVEVHREPSPRRQEASARDVKELKKRFESPSGSPPAKVTTTTTTTAVLANGKPSRPDAKVTPKAIVSPNVRSPPHVSRINVTASDDKPLANGLPAAARERSKEAEQSPRTRDEKHHRRNETNEPAEIASMEDVPKDISVLSAENVCKCLVLLNMERHVPEFQRRQVDGRLLITLKETVLINDYKFTPFLASKLMRFIRGWRPKSS